MNYIKQMMEDKGIEVNEEFYVIKKGVKFKAQVVVNYGIIIYDDKVKSFKFAESSIYHEILSGYCEIEKIKPKGKTLVEQVREQGKYYYINAHGEVDNNTTFNRFHARVGNIFLTQSDAEKEVYRRKLEFEMQEWAKEHNEGDIDWGDFSEEKCSIYYHFNEKEVDCCSNWEYKNSADFDVYFTSTTVARCAVEKFGDRMKKYYEWESGENE